MKAEGYSDRYNAVYDLMDDIKLAISDHRKQCPESDIADIIGHLEDALYACEDKLAELEPMMIAEENEQAAFMERQYLSAVAG